MSQPTLRISQSTIGPGQYRAELRFEGDGQPRFTARADFEFQLTPQRREDVRWYLEDYLQYPHDPAPKIAARVEADMQAIGVELFAKVMQANDDTRDLWAQLRRRLDDTRIEIETSVAEATSIPWELIHDPKTNVSLALRATALVRSHSQAAQRPELPRAETGPIRILLAICRPGGDSDVPFRSVASQLIKGLGDQATGSFQLDVLRPATYEQLARTLQQAKAERRPYHVVHFDGHGMYAEVAEPTGDEAEAAAEWLQLQGALMLSGPRAGRHGYLLFERPDHETNMQLVDGPTIANLLVTNDVSVLVLNACRSAHAEAPSEPETVTSDNIHEQVRAFGSLAQEVMDAGVAGVVAMRYNVYVVTAAQFVADLYGALIAGRTLGEAVSFGRKQLHAQPMREISYAARSLQDWCVPVVYEAAPIRLFEARSSESPQFTIQAGSAMHGRGAVDRDLPRPPDVGFYGRDETVLALDRAFDNHRIVLLHAFAGSGKTMTAAEFARWYAMTGGVADPPLFTTFETKRPLSRVLDAIGQRFGARLEQAGIHWLTLDDDQRRDVALQVLGQVPVLWLWDNVEPIMGLPTASPATGSHTTDELDSAAGYTPDERQALADFLRDAAAIKAKILLTSRRDEQKWLGELPCRITVPPMPMLERVQLTRALAERRQRRLTDVDDWRPLLRFTQGNPLTITVLVGQALRDNLKTKQQIEAFVGKLRAGEAAFDDEISEGRTRSLGASLSYGFEHAFTEEERRILSLLHLFQGFVNVDVLRFMGNPERDWCLAPVRGLPRERGIALLDRATDVGLLTAVGDGCYEIHPAVPWFLRSLFERYFPAVDNGMEASVNGEAQESLSAIRAIRAFVEATGEEGEFYCQQYYSGNNDVISWLWADEANLLFARRLAIPYQWHKATIKSMQGLRNLYHLTGRRIEWRRLVEEVVSNFVDRLTDGPQAGVDAVLWELVTEYRVRLAVENRELILAERLQRLCVEWNQEQIEVMLCMPSGTDIAVMVNRFNAGRPEFAASQWNAVRNLSVALHELAEIQRELEQTICVANYLKSLAWADAISDDVGAAACAYNLGNAFKDLKVIRDWKIAEQWYRTGLDRLPEQDHIGRARFLIQLGSIALDQMRAGVNAGQNEVELRSHFQTAVRSSHDALKILPKDAANDLATANNQLGNLYCAVGDFEQALNYCGQAIKWAESAGNSFFAAKSRFNAAIVLSNFGRLPDAREYALAALRDFQKFGAAAAHEVANTERLLARINQAIQEQGS